MNNLHYSYIISYLRIKRWWGFREKKTKISSTGQENKSLSTWNALFIQIYEQKFFYSTKDSCESFLMVKFCSWKLNYGQDFWHCHMLIKIELKGDTNELVPIAHGHYVQSPRMLIKDQWTGTHYILTKNSHKPGKDAYLQSS